MNKGIVVEAKKAKNGLDLSPLWKKEDWWTVWLGIILIVAAAVGGVAKPALPKKWAEGGILESIPVDLIPGILVTGVICWILFSLAVYFFKKEQVKKFAVSFPVIFLLGIGAYVMGNYAPWRHYGFNNVVWALVIGLIISNTVKTPAFLKNAAFTELFIKTGLVLLGASILFNRVLALGVMGLGVAWIVTPLIVLVMYWFSQKVLKMKDDKSLAITIVAALSVCGVSAAIATGAASKAKKEEISLAISISLIFTILMMILMPALIRLFGIDPIVGGAWIGGTVDATGAVVAASTLLGEEAMQVASVIKMIQNILIGIIAFGVAVYWATVYEKDGDSKTSVKPIEIWNRMPKFILGFIGASLIFSFFLSKETVDATLPVLDGYRELFFTLAFISIGLESNFKDMAKMVKGGKPLVLYLTGQILNIVITLAAAYIFFSGRFFALPF